MSWMTLLRVGREAIAAVADPQLQFFENIPAALVGGEAGYNNGILSVHAVNIPLSISLNTLAFLISQNNTQGRTFTYRFGLYTLNGATLSALNSGSATNTFVNGFSWVSMTNFSSAQNISPGPYYLGFLMNSAGNSSASFEGGAANNVFNAIPGGFMSGVMTVSTAAIPASIATSALDITGNDAMGQPYLIITA